MNNNIYNILKVSKFYSSYSSKYIHTTPQKKFGWMSSKNSGSASYFPLKILKEIENQPRLKNFNLHLILTCDMYTQAETWGILRSNRENHEHQKYFWNVIVLQEESQSGMRKLNSKQERWLVCGFVASLYVLIFAVIQEFTVFPAAL